MGRWSRPPPDRWPGSAAAWCPAPGSTRGRRAPGTLPRTPLPPPPPRSTLASQAPLLGQLVLGVAPQARAQAPRGQPAARLPEPLRMRVGPHLPRGQRIVPGVLARPPVAACAALLAVAGDA